MKLSDQITRRHLFVAFGTSSQSGTLSSVDLAATRDNVSVTLTASDGSVAPIAGADASTAGVMTAADKAKLEGLPPTTTREFGALSEVPGAMVGGAITHLRTAGYSNAGDGGGALYKRVAVEPPHPGKLQSADSAWWEIVPQNGRVNVRQLGAKGDGDFTNAPVGQTNDRQAFIDAFSAAHALRAEAVFVPSGDYDLVSGISLSGYACTLIGESGRKTIIRASAQTGPVLDMTGWAGKVSNQHAGVRFGGFQLFGDNAADATKANMGIKAPSISGVHFFDIGIRNTGGPCFQTGTNWWCVYDNMVFNRPVGADTNDVPYVDINDWHNGNLWLQPKFRSIVTTNDGLATFRAKKGATVLERTFILAPSFEYQHVPENGALMDIEANHWIIDGIQLFDIESDSAFTNACAIRLRGSNGCEVRGILPGKGDGLVSLSYGVIVEGTSHRNRITGMKSYRKNNVLLKSGTQYNYIELGGQESGNAAEGDPGVVNNSGNSDNVIVDHTTREIDWAGKFSIDGNGTFTQTRARFNEGLTVTARYSTGEALQVYGLASQSGPQLTVRNSAAAYLFAVEADGKLRTNQTSAGATLGNVTNKMPVYNAAGTLVGYVPIYDSIT